MTEPSPRLNPEITSDQRLLAGRFEILEEVSHGSFGRIMKVRVPGLDRILAAKVDRLSRFWHTARIGSTYCEEGENIATAGQVRSG